MTECIVADCARRAAKRGCCNAHYIRLRRHGEPTRPEGAEELDALVDASIRGCSNITSPATVQTISNGLAESGVRVVTEEQEPTDAEVEAAANALADWDGADWHAETWDGEIPREAYRAGARRALSAARAVGRGAR